MTPKNNGSDKKARWSRTQKQDVRRSQARNESMGRRSERGSSQRRDDNRSGFDRRDDNRGGFQRRDDDRGGRGFDRRDESRGGFQRRDDRGGFNRRDDRGGYQRRDDNRGGYGRRDDRSDRGGFNRRDDRLGRPDRSFRKDELVNNEATAEARTFEVRDEAVTEVTDTPSVPDVSTPILEETILEAGDEVPADVVSSNAMGDLAVTSDSDEAAGSETRDDSSSTVANDGGAREADAASAPEDAPGAPEETDDDVQLTFADLGLPSALVERLARDGIDAPFPIQAATIPDALSGKDVLGRGRTGSGKTLGFGLPMLTRLAEGGKARAHMPRAIVLVPTRELAMQVSDALQPLVHVVGLKHKLVAGGMPYEPQLSALERGVDILIATPGRLSDLIERGAADLSRVEIAVLDEADHMAEMGFLEAITEILDLVPEGGQRLLFSATLDRGIDTLVDKYLVDPVTHSTDDGTASVTTMEHHALIIEPRDKKVVTAEVANREGRTVVFVRTKMGADRVAAELREQGVMAAALHGGLNQGQRNRVLSAFKDGRVPVLVATDVAARGIHVDEVGVVLQVDPPADHKDYLHRAGRTARAGEKGTVVTLALPHQRRSMQRLLDDAGVDTRLAKARPGDEVIVAAGGSTPEGRSISEDDLRRTLAPRDRGPRGGGRGGNDRGGRGGRGGYGRDDRGRGRGGYGRGGYDRDDRGRGGFDRRDDRRDDRGGRDFGGRRSSFRDDIDGGFERQNRRSGGRSGGFDRGGRGDRRFDRDNRGDRGGYRG